MAALRTEHHQSYTMLCKFFNDLLRLEVFREFFPVANLTCSVNLSLYMTHSFLDFCIFIYFAYPAKRKLQTNNGFQICLSIHLSICLAHILEDLGVPHNLGVNISFLWLHMKNAPNKTSWPVLPWDS